MSLYHFTGRCFLNKQIPRQVGQQRQIPHFRGGRFYSYSPTSLMRCDSVWQAEMASAQWRNVAHAVPVSVVPTPTHFSPYHTVVSPRRPLDWPSFVLGRWKQWKCCAHLKISQVYLPDIISYKLRNTHTQSWLTHTETIGLCLLLCGIFIVWQRSKDEGDVLPVQRPQATAVTK